MKPDTIRRKKRRGFTLMEMLIVLGILVLLLAMVTPRILRSRKQADVSATKAQIQFLQGCLEHYVLHVKEFPATEQGLRALIEEPTDGEETTASRWQGPYTRTGELPQDPWGNDYQYEYPPTQGNGDLPDIWSYGPDGEDNTEDDIVSWKQDEGEEEEGLGDLTDEPQRNPKQPRPEPEPKDI